MRSRIQIALVLCLVAILISLSSSPTHGQQSVQFAAAGDYALIPHDSLLVLPRTTVEVWIRVHALGDTSLAGGEQSVLDMRGGGGGYQFRLAGAQSPLGAGIASGTGFIFYPDLVYAYRWHHMALSQDADSMSFYLDGALIDRLENDYPSGNMSDLFLGELTGCLSGCLWLRGEIDDLRIWNRARSEAEIADSLHVKLAGDEPGLVGYWDFDGDTGTTLTDLTTGGNDGRLFGAAVLVPSDAPVGFVPLPAPTGLRTYGGEMEVRILWKPPASMDLGGYAIYRADTLFVPLDPDHLLATVSASDSSYVDASAVLDRTHYYVIAAVDAGGHLGDPTEETAGRRTHIPKDYLVGTYYWPSRRPDPWWQGFYLRDFLVPRQPPALGHYDSRDPAVLDRHLDWMLEYGVDFFACEWLGQTSSEDSVLRENILPALVGRPTEFTVYYHPETLPDVGNIDPVQEDQLVSDFTYIAGTYFDHSNFLHFQGRPVVFMNRSVRFGGAYEQAFARVRTELLQLGHEVYLVGDEITRTVVPDVAHMQYVDAITMWRSVSRPSEQIAYVLNGNGYGSVARFLSVWHETALAKGKGFLPAVCPGVNTRQLNPGWWIVPRESQAGAGPTSQLEEQIRTLRSYITPQLNAIMVWSWNHWESDTQVEPSVVAEATREDASGTGQYTGGYSYTGYGTRCLETIQWLLGYDPGRVILTFPPDAATGQPRRAHLSWSELEGASTYQLQVATTPDFSSLVVDRDLLAAAETVTDTLAANTTFHWRVRGQSSGGSGAWSDPFTFTTGTLVPVRLAYLRAERLEAGGVALSWEVLDFAGSAGFHVYREEPAGETGGSGEGPAGRVRITARLLTGGPVFSFTDEAAPDRTVDYWLQELGRAGEEHWHGPVQAPAATPRVWTLGLAQSRPNPMRSTATLTFTLPAAGEAQLEILDLGGRVVARPFGGDCPAGPREVAWDGRDARGRPLPSGVYFYRLVTEAGTRTAKLMVLR